MTSVKNLGFMWCLGLWANLFKILAQKLVWNDILRQLKLYDTYKRNLKIAQENVHRPNLIKSIYTFSPTYSTIRQIQGKQVKINQPKLG